MNHRAVIEEISDKYGYDEELQIAIEITIPLMIKEYGEDKLDDIYNLFRNTRIFSTSDMSKEHREAIEKEMIGGTNRHVVFKDDNDPYQSDRDPDSCYSYQAIYDENMNVTGEVIWIVVKDMKDNTNGVDYKNLFGTTVNIPYFIHEVGHAFAMQNAIYKKEDDKIYAKHGMYEEVISFEQKDDKVEIDSDSLNSIILEETANELNTQNMLKDLMGAVEYETVKEKLSSIGHIFTAYNSIILSLTDKLEKVLGKEQLLKYRRDNDKSVIEEFDLVAKKSEIASKYCSSSAFNMLDKKCYALYLLEAKKHTMIPRQYGDMAKELMMDGYAPLCAYQDKKYGTMPIETYEEVRAQVLGIKPELKVESPQEENKTM